MAVADLYDPLTGLPRRLNQPNVGAPVAFNAAAVPPGGVGGGTTTGTGAVAAPGQAMTPVQFQQMLEQDPLYRQSLADLTAQSVSDRAGLTAARRQAIIRFGADEGTVGALGDLGGDIDPTTLALAQQNTQAGLSTTARMEKAYKDSLRGVRNTLAARGALQSGEFGHQLGELDLSRRQVGFDARNQLVDALSGYAAGFANAERARAAARAQAAGNVYNQQVQYPPPAAPPAAPPGGDTGARPDTGPPNRAHSAANVVPGTWPPPRVIAPPPPPPPRPVKTWFG